MARPRIAFVAGDPNGIGPELAAKLLARPGNVEAAEVVVFADPRAIAEGERVAGVKARIGPGAAALRPQASEGAITPGQAAEAGGRAAR
jgi:4-hydroxythreonine-4-phosphate dehydrogenase